MLAARTGLKVRYIAQLENDPQNVTIQTLAKLADGLNVSVSDLVGVEDTRKEPAPEALAGLDDAIRLLQSYRGLAERRR